MIKIWIQSEGITWVMGKYHNARLTHEINFSFSLDFRMSLSGPLWGFSFFHYGFFFFFHHWWHEDILSANDSPVGL